MLESLNLHTCKHGRELVAIMCPVLISNIQRVNVGYTLTLHSNLIEKVSE